MDKYYTGITQVGVGSRLSMHNESGYGTHYTSQASDWELYLEIPCASVRQSMRIEQHIKKMKSKKFIQDLNRYPAIVEKLKEKYAE